MNTYLIASKKRAKPVLPELWTLDFTDFENLSLNRRIGLYHSLYYQLEFLKQYAKPDFDRAFIPVLEQCFSDMKAFEGAYLFDLNQFEVSLSSAANEYYKDMKMYVLGLEEAHVVFELGYDGEFLLYLDYNDPTFREILESHFNTSKEKANLDKIFQKGVEVYVPPALLPHMVEEESIPFLEDYFNSRLQPAYQFLLEQGQPLNLKPNSYLSDYYFMYEDGKFYSFLLSNYCESCSYDKSKRIGANACPFNSLYWNFLDDKKTYFKNNNRMAMMLRLLEKMPAEELTALKIRAKNILENPDGF